jgi:hypothetical protein
MIIFRATAGGTRGRTASVPSLRGRIVWGPFRRSRRRQALRPIGMSPGSAAKDHSFTPYSVDRSQVRRFLLALVTSICLAAPAVAGDGCSGNPVDIATDRPDGTITSL